jgi:hypothetical protein
MRSKARVSLLLVLSFIGAAAAHAVCPAAPFYIDLKSGLVGTLGGPNTNVGVSGFIASPVVGCAGWKEAVLKINFAGGCTKATIWAQWEGLPKAWTLNIGDSPTNDGFGGGVPGTTLNDAELWVLNERMSVANGGSTVDTIYNQDQSLTDSALNFVVKNQYISWGQPYGFLQTPNLKNLFALSAVDPLDVTNGANNIYAGLNRVIYNAPANGRRGCGLRRVLVALQ